MVRAQTYKEWTLWIYRNFWNNFLETFYVVTASTNQYTLVKVGNTFVFLKATSFWGLSMYKTKLCQKTVVEKFCFSELKINYLLWTWSWLFTQSSTNIFCISIFNVQGCFVSSLTFRPFLTLDSYQFGSLYEKETCIRKRFASQQIKQLMNKSSPENVLHRY